MNGYDRLWKWFGLSRASFLTIPRVLLHDMPDDWQNKLAELLEGIEEAYPNHPAIGLTIRATKDGKLFPIPDWMLNYRHPDQELIDSFKGENHDTKRT